MFHFCQGLVKNYILKISLQVNGLVKKMLF